MKASAPSWRIPSANGRRRSSRPAAKDSATAFGISSSSASNPAFPVKKGAFQRRLFCTEGLNRPPLNPPHCGCGKNHYAENNAVPPEPAEIVARHKTKEPVNH